MCKHQNLTFKTKIDVFSPLLRSIVAAGVTIDATAIYEFSISSRARNAEAHRVTGNVHRSKIPECVKKLRSHDRARAAMCAGCDRYIGNTIWSC